MAARRYPQDVNHVRKLILALAVPGQFLPCNREIAAWAKVTQPNVSRHIEKLRDEWKLVTRPVIIYKPFLQGGGRRLMVVEVNP